MRICSISHSIPSSVDLSFQAHCPPLPLYTTSKDSNPISKNRTVNSFTRKAAQFLTNNIRPTPTHPLHPLHPALKSLLTTYRTLHTTHPHLFAHHQTPTHNENPRTHKVKDHEQTNHGPPNPPPHRPSHRPLAPPYPMDPHEARTEAYRRSG